MRRLDAGTARARLWQAGPVHTESGSAARNVNRTPQSQKRQNVRRLRDVAEARAAEQSKLVDAVTLNDAVERYVQWETLALWIRAVVTSEHAIPDFVSAELKSRCPGFLEARTAASVDTLCTELLDWIENHVFRTAVCEGWIDAVTFNARRRQDSRKVWKYWERSQRRWQARRPSEYPSFSDWLAQAGAR